MSFKFSRFFTLAINFIIGSFFLLVGLAALILPWRQALQKNISEFFLENTVILSLFGLGFALIGISIILYAIQKTKHRYVEIKTGNLGIILDENVIRSYLDAYWLEKFPNDQIPYLLNFKKHSLQIVADLPFLSLAEQKTFLERVKHDFSDLFSRVLGYPYDVHFIASFEAAKK